MAIVIRDIDLERDPEQIVEMYLRAGYGAAIGNGMPLTADDFRLMMKRNHMCVMMVADDDGRIVGIQGTLAVDACRSAPPGHVWGNHLVIDASARGGFVMGEMSVEILPKLRAIGISSIHARVNPKNRQAMRLDVRSGFRAVGSDRPDADSFVELVSHVPIVTSLAEMVVADPDTGHAFVPKLTLSALRAGRGDDMADGVGCEDGRTEMAYPFGDKDLDGAIVLDGQSGKVVRVVVNGIDHTVEFDRRYTSRRPAVFELDVDALNARFKHLTTRRCGPFTCSIDPLGRLHVDHPGHLGPVVLDCFPDGAGHTVAYRRPPVLDLTAAESADGWTLRAADGTERTITVGPDGIDVVCRAPAGAA
ncbi:MAG: hypothetical protein LBH76_10980, partial [Propionibacteriaceae bacterium]|nr:hypothetical protein [Propionibacteriaceae bacterium]